MNTSSVLRNIQKQLSKGIVAKIKHKERSPGDQEESQSTHYVQTAQVDNATVEKGLQALQTEIKSAPKPVQHKHEYKQPDLDDLNPFPTNADNKKANAQNQQSSTKEEDIEALFKGKLSQKEVQEKIKALKDSPELIQAYVLKLERKRREEEQQLQIKALNEKMLHRKQMYNMVQLPMPVMTGEYLQEHKRDIRSDKFHKEVIYKDIIIKGQELLNRIVHVNHQKALIDKRKKQSYKPKFHTDIPILPITFIKQRNELLSMCYIASRLSLLYFTSSKYSQINAFNVDLISKVNSINKNLKCRFFRSNFLKQREASGKLQSQLKLLIVMKRNQLRINALKDIKSFLYRNYNQNTFLGPVKRVNDDVAVIKSYLEQSQVNFEARIPFIQIKLEQADKKAAFNMAQQALFDADVKAQKASKKPFVEKDINTFQPTDDDVNVYLMDPDDIKVIANVLLKALYKTYAHDLVDTYDNNMNYSPMTPSAFSLVPRDDLCMQIITKYKATSIESEADIDLSEFEIEREVVEEPDE